jgi:hypothetical protein
VKRAVLLDNVTLAVLSSSSGIIYIWIASQKNLGMGEKFDQSATRKMPAGTYGFWPAGMRHFAWAKGCE